LTLHTKQQQWLSAEEKELFMQENRVGEHQRSQKLQIHWPGCAYSNHSARKQLTDTIYHL
jgi:hypothetical protein